jgi:hypothetical protein
VTVTLPEPVYRRIERAAKQSQRSVAQILGDAAAALTPEANELPADMQTALAQMAFLNDAALWRAARTTLQQEQQKRLETLHDKQQRTALSPTEQAEEQALVKLYRETQLVRAHAIMLLMQRGYDVSDPQSFSPIR